MARLAIAELEERLAVALARRGVAEPAETAWAAAWLSACAYPGLAILNEALADAAREKGLSGMPEGFGTILTRQEIRDLVEFIAMDEDNGNVLWRFQTGSAVNAQPITYTHKGRQYVSVLSGIAGGTSVQLRAENIQRGGSVWTFALMPD